MPQQYKILHFKQAPWKVGERETDRKARVKAGEDVDLRDLYPDSYPGQVISVIPAWQDFTPGELCDPTRAILKLKLTADELADLRSRRSHIGTNRRPAPVSFDQRHGAVAPELKRHFPLDFLVREREEEEKLLAAEERNAQAVADWQAEVDTWRESLAEAVELGAVFDTPAPARPALEDLPEPEFAQMKTRLTKLLPKTEVHTGAGLYKVRAAGTIATPAHLWAMETVNPTDDGDPGGNDGTGLNVNVVAGVIGHALEFTDGNSNVNVGDVTALNSAQAFTIAFRINQDIEGPQDFIFWKQLDGDNYVRVRLDGDLTFEIVTDGTSTRGYFARAGIINAGQFHHVAIVYNGLGVGNTGRVQIYVDGLPITLTYQGTIPATTPDLATSDARIGWTWNALDGKLDDFRIYTEALPDAQVKAIAGRGLTHYDTIAGFVENLLLRSDDLTAGAWIKSNSSVVGDEIAGPDGTTNADRLTDAGAAAQAYQSLAGGILTDNLQYTIATYVKAGDTPDFSLVIRDDGASLIRARIDFEWTGAVPSVKTEDAGTGTITDDGDGWYRATATCPAGVIVGANAHSVRLYPTERGNGDTGKYMYYANSQLVEGTTPGSYIRTEATAMHAVTLTTGGLTEDARNGEVLVSGGNNYPVIKAYAAQVNVVGDPTGESGDCSISPYTHGQSAADQLWTDQGSAAFTASQYIRMFAGTYVETITPNASLNPDEGSGETLIIEGDPTDVRTNIIIQPTTSYGFNIGLTAGILRHLKVAGASCNQPLVYLSGTRFVVRDCVLSGATASSYAALRFCRLVEDCLVENNGSTRGIFSNREATVRRCVVTQAVADTGDGITLVMHGEAEACVVSGFETGFLTSNYYGTGGFLLRQNTVYDCVNAFESAQPAVDHWTLVNNIVKDCTYVVRLAAGGWPEETTVKHGGDFLLRNNCFHGYTNFAYDGTDTKTYAEFAAFNLVDASGDLDATDPLLTDPGADDFSLQAASPCGHTGHGSGVTGDYLGISFDPYHPDIGAWSSGTAAVPAAPEITAFVNDGTGTSATLTIDAENDLDITTVRYRLTSETNWTEFGTTLTGDGDLQITGLTVGSYIFEAFSSRTWLYGYSKPSAPILGYVSGDGDEIPDMHDDLARSLVYYLQHARYSTRSVSGTLFDHFRDSSRGQVDLRIGLGYPEEPVEKLPPCIFLGGMDHRPGSGTIGNQNIIETFSCVFFGYVGLESDNTDRKSNKRLRDELQNDVYYLLNRDAEGVDIDFYNFTDDDVPDSGDSWSVRVSQARSRAIDPASHVESNRFMFEVSFDVFVLTTR
jgi:hypothetical protein